MSSKRTISYAIFIAFILSLNSFFISASSYNPSKLENYAFCPIETKTLTSKCGRYINNGGIGVSSGCCELLEQAGDVDANLAFCLCPSRGLNKQRRYHRHHRTDHLYKPQTAINIVNACNLIREYEVDLSCK